MYGDIIPPSKKKYAEHIDEPVHFSSMRRTPYQPAKSKKVPVFLTLGAILAFALILYHKVYNGTTLTVVPKTTEIVIQESIPLILQSREKDTLTYSLVYVPERSMSRGLEEVRNPFATASATSTEAFAEPEPTMPEFVTITATSTDDTKRIRLVNTSNESVTLRINTRFAVGSTTYTLDAAEDVGPSDASLLRALASTTPTYKVIGFAGSSLYDKVYAVPADALRPSAPGVVQAVASTTSTATDSVSTIPPRDVLALMPDDAIPLTKSTIYDKVLEQSAVVVFDSRTLEDFLNATNIQSQNYFKALKPFGPSIRYKIAIADYTLQTSPETGKPVALTSLTLEVTPVIDEALVPGQFAGFKKETMEKIGKQVSDYLDFKAAYTPFWASAVASEDRIQVRTK